MMTGGEKECNVCVEDGVGDDEVKLALSMFKECVFVPSALWMLPKSAV